MNLVSNCLLFREEIQGWVSTYFFYMFHGIAYPDSYLFLKNFKFEKCSPFLLSPFFQSFKLNLYILWRPCGIVLKLLLYYSSFRQNSSFLVPLLWIGHPYSSIGNRKLDCSCNFFDISTSCEACNAGKCVFFSLFYV